MSASTLHVPPHGAPKTSLRIPGSFDLYLCPPSCARRISLRSLRNGTRDQAAYLYLSEADLATGAYEQALLEAVDDLMVLKDPIPDAILVHLNCIDDFLGTDMDALIDQMRAAHPSVEFGVARLNPIADDRRDTPGERIHEQLYELIRPGQPREAAVNIVGTFVPVLADSELAPCLAALGVREVRYLFSCADYASYQRLGRSCLNLVLGPIGCKAARAMERRLGIAGCPAFVSYAMGDIDGDWARILDALEAALPSADGMAGGAARAEAEAVLACARTQALEALEAARAAVGGRPIVVDSSSSMRPAALARALAGAGFIVSALVLTHEKATDREDVARLGEESPATRVLRRLGPEDLPALAQDDPLCVGFDSAYLLRARHFVDLRKDEGLFGYQAVSHLARAMASAMEEEVRWDEGAEAGPVPTEGEGR